MVHSSYVTLWITDTWTPPWGQKITLVIYTDVKWPNILMLKAGPSLRRTKQ